MDRRHFIKAVTGLGVSMIIPSETFAQIACPQGVLIDNATLAGLPQAPLLEVMPQLYQETPSVLLGHHMHTDPLPLIYAFGKDHINAMKQSGKKHLVAEFPIELQSLFDEIADGSRHPYELVRGLVIPWLNPRQNKAVMMTIAQGLPLMKEAGIGFHCCDTSMSEVSVEDLRAMNEYLKGKAPENKEASKRILDARLDDRARYSLLRAKTGNDPYVAIIGAMHLQSHPHSIRSLCGDNAKFTISMYGNASVFQEAHEKYCHYDADYAVLIDDNLALQTGKRALPIMESTPSPSIPVLKP